MRTEDWGGAAHFETQDGSRQLYYYADSQSRGKWSLDFRNQQDASNLGGWYYGG